MNKRQKKKLYKKKTGKNPPKQLHYSGKEYHKAIRKPWGGEKPLENYSWESEEVKRAVAKAAKAFTVKETVERLKTLFAKIGISLPEISEPGSYAKNTENIVHTAEKLAQRRKAIFHRWTEIATVVEPPLLVGGSPGGQTNITLAIVEYKNGKVEQVYPGEIKFMDTQEYWPDQEK